MKAIHFFFFASKLASSAFRLVGFEHCEEKTFEDQASLMTAVMKLSIVFVHSGPLALSLAHLKHEKITYIYESVNGNL